MFTTFTLFLGSDFDNFRCTVDKAYKQGCAALIHQDENQVIMFHILSAISILIQIYLYRGFLSIFVWTASMLESCIRVYIVIDRYIKVGK